MAKMTEVMFLKLLLSRQFQFSMGGHNKRQLGQKKKKSHSQLYHFFLTDEGKKDVIGRYYSPKMLLIHFSHCSFYLKASLLKSFQCVEDHLQNCTHKSWMEKDRHGKFSRIN